MLFHTCTLIKMLILKIKKGSKLYMRTNVSKNRNISIVTLNCRTEEGFLYTVMTTFKTQEHSTRPKIAETAYSIMNHISAHHNRMKNTNMHFYEKKCNLTALIDRLHAQKSAKKI